MLRAIMAHDRRSGIGLLSLCTGPYPPQKPTPIIVYSCNNDTEVPSFILSGAPEYQ